MEVSNYFRLALMFGENKASTFKKNLEKMITLVLFDVFPDGFTIPQIIKEIEIKYGLEFSDTEVITSIENKNQHSIIEINDEKDISCRKYAITPTEKEKIILRTDDQSLRAIILDFLAIQDDFNFDANQFCQLLVKYMYDIFNSNADIILAMINGPQEWIKPVNFDYTEDEKEAINKFLYWEDPIKNKCVYQLISVCFDYCMMTVRKDKAVYSAIFKQRKFYLDTNIVFRLMGLNNAGRKQVIGSFVRKCEDVGIQICYSNHTKKELFDTIDYYVNQIKLALSNSAPLSVRAMSCINDRLSKSDFYDAYVKWTQDPINKTCDYSAFAEDLKRNAIEVLSGFRQINFDDYSIRRQQDFVEQFESLRQFKISLGKTTYDPAIKVDVNNYMFVLEKNKCDHASDFFSTNNYLISADHAFSTWDREKRPQAIPTVVLPSVWYSIILKYSGRTTDDDYSSFTRFLNFSFSDTAEQPDLRKMEILRYVLSLQEPTTIKEKTVFDISQKLQTDYKDLSTDEIVEAAHQYVIDSILEEEKAKLMAEQEEALSKQKALSEAQQQTKEEEYKASIARITAQACKNIDILSQEKHQISQDAEESIKRVRIEERNRYIDREVQRKVSNRIKLYISLTGLLVIGFFVILTYTGKWVFSVDDATEVIQMRYDYLKYVIDAFYLIVSGCIVGFVFKGFDKEKIEKAIRPKVERASGKDISN